MSVKQSQEWCAKRMERDVSPEPNTGCWLWTAGVNDSGYGQLSVGGHPERAHRVAFVAANGAITYGAFVLHRCDNRLCVNPAHLFLGTHADNMRDKISKRRHIHGPSHPHAKLAAAQVEEIRAAPLGGLSALARRFGISPSAASLIHSGRTWRCP